MLILVEFAGTVFDYEAGICGEDMEGIIGMIFSYRVIRMDRFRLVNILLRIFTCFVVRFEFF